MKTLVWTKMLCIYAPAVHVVSVLEMPSLCRGSYKVNLVSIRRNLGFREFCLDLLLVFTVSRLLHATNFLLTEENNFYI